MRKHVLIFFILFISIGFAQLPDPIIWEPDDFDFGEFVFCSNELLIIRDSTDICRICDISYISNVQEVFAFDVSNPEYRILVDSSEPFFLVSVVDTENDSTVFQYLLQYEEYLSLLDITDDFDIGVISDISYQNNALYMISSDGTCYSYDTSSFEPLYHFTHPFPTSQVFAHDSLLFIQLETPGEPIQLVYLASNPSSPELKTKLESFWGLTYAFDRYWGCKSYGSFDQLYSVLNFSELPYVAYSRPEGYTMIATIKPPFIGNYHSSYVPERDETDYYQVYYLYRNSTFTRLEISVSKYDHIIGNFFLDITTDHLNKIYYTSNFEDFNLLESYSSGDIYFGYNDHLLVTKHYQSSEYKFYVLDTTYFNPSAPDTVFNSNDLLTVFPNPCFSTFYARFDSLSSLEVFDLNGRCVNRFTEFDNTNAVKQIQLPDQTGLFFVRGKFGNKVQTRKIVNFSN